MKIEDLTPFQRGFFEAMFFTNFGADDGDLCEKGFSDLSPPMLFACLEDCDTFYRNNLPHIMRAMDVKVGHPPVYDEEMAGRDFWFTRNHHGVGFWDRGLGELGNTLTKAAHGYRELAPYLGGNGRVYI